MMTAECEGAAHVFKADSGPGTLCACGKTVWIIPKSKDLSTIKGVGPQDVDEPLQK